LKIGVMVSEIYEATCGKPLGSVKFDELVKAAERVIGMYRYMGIILHKVGL